MSGIADKGQCGERLVRGRRGGKSGLVFCILTLQRRREAGEGAGKFLLEVSEREN